MGKIDIKSAAEDFAGGYMGGYVDALECFEAGAKYVLEQLPKWSEKDNRLMGNIVDVLEDYQVNDSYKEEIDWLYDLRQKLDTKTPIL